MLWSIVGCVGHEPATYRKALLEVVSVAGPRPTTPVFFFVQTLQGSIWCSKQSGRVLVMHAFGILY